MAGLLNPKKLDPGKINECTFIVVVLLAFPCVSVLHMTVVALERYVTIMYPLRHFVILSRRNLVLAVVLCWVSPLLGFSIAGTVWHKIERNTENSTNFVCSLDLVTPCSVLYFLSAGVVVFYGLAVVLYVRIFRVAIKQVRRVASQTMTTTSENGHRAKIIRSQVKVAFLMFMTAGVFTISYLPLSISLSTLCTDTGELRDYKIFKVFSFLAFLNSGLNPLIYGLGNRPIRQGFVTCCSDWKRRTFSRTRRV
ncbi:D(1A) dopamine receptor-like [Liolophura sinensis]|uniref:D(1A) dopamine receptor-like n=1 Tax=Liolophura sinensis TaxID=3198878 RepID=UPI00315924A5